MLIDVHSHLFKYPDHFTEDFRRQSFRGRNKELDLTVRWEEYHRAATQCDNTIVFGGKAKLSGLWVPDRDVANYVQQAPDNSSGSYPLIGNNQAGRMNSTKAIRISSSRESNCFQCTRASNPTSRN